jgi:hypothetical protein
VVAKPKAAQDHLSHAEPGSKGRKEGDWDDSQEIDEEDGEERIDESQTEHRYCQHTDGKGRDHHVGGTPHRSHLEGVLVCSLIFRDTFDATLLDTKSSGQSLQSGIESISHRKRLPVDRTGGIGGNAGSMLLAEGRVVGVLDVTAGFLVRRHLGKSAPPRTKCKARDKVAEGKERI